MLGRQTSSKAGALALALPGDRVDIRQIAFDAVRARCRQLGLAASDTVTCRAVSSSHMIVQSASGRNVAIEWEYARRL